MSKLNRTHSLRDFRLLMLLQSLMPKSPPSHCYIVPKKAVDKVFGTAITSMLAAKDAHLVEDAKGLMCAFEFGKKAKSSAEVPDKATALHAIEGGSAKRNGPCARVLVHYLL